MTYKGYEIILERSQCEIWSLDDNGDADQFEYDCNDSTHEHWANYVAVDDAGKWLCAASEIETVKNYIDRLEKAS